ncbi:MAG: type II secretion system GspH family protein [Lachnospiraceae bacterium]|nr:type II secretion system GspH family protein [Lachnospiraceae bacterium]
MKNNNGFSLVELIVVIAIMAILVGVLAPSVLGQIDKANVAKDKQACDAVLTAFATAYADQDVTTGKPSASGAITSVITFADSGSQAAVTTSGSTFTDAVRTILGYSNVVWASNTFKGSSQSITFNPVTGKFTLTVTSSAGSTIYTISK